MAREGFIKDTLDIKFLILFICARIIEPIPIEAVQDLTMCDDGIDYFDFTECLNHLVATGHLTRDHEGNYEITDKGLHNSQVCESSLPYSVRMKAEKNIACYNQKLRRQGLVKTQITPRDNGTYTLSLTLNDDVDNVMKLEMMVAKQEMAQELAKRFKRNAEAIYGKILTSLFDEAE